MESSSSNSPAFVADRAASTVAAQRPMKAGMSNESNPYILGERLVCCVCGHRVDPQDSHAFVTIPCHVRAFAGENFQLWRCVTCRTIHCRHIVDLTHYYAKYPFAQAT